MSWQSVSPTVAERRFDRVPAKVQTTRYTGMGSGKQGLGGSALPLFAGVGLGAGEAMAIEEPGYTVIE